MTTPIDWGEGDYGPTARTLLPAAETVVAIAALQPGERVVDVGCGTGNVTGLALAAGAIVTAVDPSQRLLDRAASAMPAGASVTFATGDAAHLPLDDRSVDAVLSNFAVIFAPDPGAAVAELARVLAPGGRIVMSAWLPNLAFAELNKVISEFVNERYDVPLPPPRWDWSDAAEVRPLFDAVGKWRMEATGHEIAFTAASPEAYFDEVFVMNPVAHAGLAVIDDEADRAEVRRRVIAKLGELNTDPSAFSAPSGYVVHRAGAP